MIEGGGTGVRIDVYVYVYQWWGVMGFDTPHTHAGDESALSRSQAHRSQSTTTTANTQLLMAASPTSVVRRGRCHRSLIEIRAFCRGYDTQLRLVGNNCQTFVEALLAFVVEEEDEDEGEGGGGAGGKNNDEDDLDEAASVLEWILGDD